MNYNTCFLFVDLLLSLAYLLLCICLFVVVGCIGMFFLCLLFFTLYFFGLLLIIRHLHTYTCLLLYDIIVCCLFTSLQQLITSETAVFDILPSFFYHKNKLIRMGALEVYVRRSYIAYEVVSVQHETVSPTVCGGYCVYRECVTTTTGILHCLTITIVTPSPVSLSHHHHHYCHTITILTNITPSPFSLSSHHHYCHTIANLTLTTPSPFSLSYHHYRHTIAILTLTTPSPFSLSYHHYHHTITILSLITPSPSSPSLLPPPYTDRRTIDSGVGIPASVFSSKQENIFQKSIKIHVHTTGV